MLFATLSGFRFLYEKVGAFAVEEDMVFIDNGGKIKVWMNPNLSKNYPLEIMPSSSSDHSSSEKTPSQSDMVSNIISLVEDNIDPLTVSHPHFSDYLHGKSLFHRLSFDKAL